MDGVFWGAIFHEQKYIMGCVENLCFNVNRKWTIALEQKICLWRHTEYLALLKWLLKHWKADEMQLFYNKLVKMYFIIIQQARLKSLTGCSLPLHGPEPCATFFLSLRCQQMPNYAMQTWKQSQTVHTHTPCPTTARHASKSPLVTRRVHCKLTHTRGMQHTRGITPSNDLLNVFVPYPSSPIPRMSYWAETGWGRA